MQNLVIAMALALTSITTFAQDVPEAFQPVSVPSFIIALDKALGSCALPGKTVEEVQSCMPLTRVPTPASFNETGLSIYASNDTTRYKVFDAQGKFIRALAADEYRSAIARYEQHDVEIAEAKRAQENEAAERAQEAAEKSRKEVEAQAHAAELTRVRSLKGPVNLRPSVSTESVALNAMAAGINGPALAMVQGKFFKVVAFTNVGDMPVVIDKIIVNNKQGCGTANDFKPKILEIGDTVKVVLDCADTVVTADVSTSRGVVSFRMR